MINSLKSITRVMFLYNFCAATENNRFSVCAYCSDKHAGVRWMMHESNNLDYLFLPDIFDLIEIKFQCHDPENNTVSSTA